MKKKWNASCTCDHQAYMHMLRLGCVTRDGCPCAAEWNAPLVAEITEPTVFFPKRALQWLEDRKLTGTLGYRVAPYADIDPDSPCTGSATTTKQ